MNNHFIYAWKLPNGTPFYIGQGTHQVNSRCHRAYITHLDDGQSGRISYAQKKANKLARLGTPHIVEILHDDLTADEADNIEKELIAIHGRKHIGTGILYNLSAGGDINPMRDQTVREKHYSITQTKEFSDKVKEGQRKANTFNEEYRAKKSEETRARLNDPVKKAEWYSKFSSQEVREKIKQVQAEVSGVKIKHNGIEYRSKKELARFLGISSQLLSYRLSNNIPLDINPSKSNRKGKDF